MDTLKRNKYNKREKSLVVVAYLPEIQLRNPPLKLFQTSLTVHVARFTVLHTLATGLVNRITHKTLALEQNLSRFNTRLQINTSQGPEL